MTDAHQKILDIVTNEEDVSWQSILMDLVKTEQMNPWDVDISLLTQKYIEIVKAMKEANLRVSGKVLLASAVMLKIKSKHLVGADIAALDQLIQSSQVVEEEDYGEYAGMDPNEVGEYNPEAARRRLASGQYGLIPRTPQLRKRKVSIYDLVNALDKAMEVRHRRILKSIPSLQRQLQVPVRGMDISARITSVYEKIKGWFFKKKETKLSFSNLLDNESREEKIQTFIPLLHLMNQRRINLEQKETFGEINIQLLKKAK